MFKTLQNAWKIEDIRKKILYTLLILFIYRLGCALPVPFLDASVLKSSMEATQLGTIFSNFNMMSGGAFSRGTLLTLGVSPYITSSIVIQLLTIAIPALENLSKEGPEGQKKITKITRYTTLALAVLESTGYYLWMRNTAGVMQYTTGAAGVFAAIVIIGCYVAGSMFSVWLGEQIDFKGLGNGISLLIFIGIIARVPTDLEHLINGFRAGGKYYAIVPLIAIVFLFMIAMTVMMSDAERRIPVQYAKRVVGRKMYGGQSSFIPIKVMMSGVMPVIFAGSILSIPSLIALVVGQSSSLGQALIKFTPANPVYIILELILIILFDYFYIAITYNPIEMANDIRKQSGAIPGIRAGEPTAQFISRVISRITLVGALFVALIAILPMIGENAFALSMAFTGTSIIIAVGVSLDTVKSLESMMMMRHYKGFLG